MRIEMKKFGNILNGRPAGREAYLRVVQIVNGSGTNQEKIVVDFAGVEILTPSFADEFLHLLQEKYGRENIQLENIESATVKEVLKAVLDPTKFTS